MLKMKKSGTGLDDSDFVCHIQGIIVWHQPNICLLCTIGPEAQKFNSEE
uniref:Uncharacterized protein n=1 Tax=Rhizophora mucronata TaxID=61149 RepID=A0A2P2KUC4_RHIMU